jgi:hypothetical protein
MSFDVIPGATKKDLVETLSAQCSESGLVGDVLWGIKVDIPGDIIVCFSMAHTADGWGYREICEWEHPYHYSCPLRFLDRTQTGSKPWRRLVRAFHASQPSSAAADPSCPPPDRSLNTPNVVTLPVSEDPQLIQKELSRLLNDYDTTSVAEITVEYVEDHSGVLFESIKFEFNTLRLPLVLPSPELLGRTLDAFSRILASYADLSSEDTHGTGVFHWNLLGDRLASSHTIHNRLEAPSRDNNR